MKRFVQTTAVLLVTLAFVAGCSSGDSSDGQASGETTAAEADGKDGSGGSSGECGDLKITGKVGDTAFTADSAAAVSIEDGKAYTVYIGNFDLSPDDISQVSVPEVPTDKVMFSVADTVFNAPDPDAVKAVAAGDEVTWTPDFGVRIFRVTAQADGESHGNNSDAEGTLTVTAAGDQFCGTIDYSDGEKSIEGTFVAPVKAL